MGGGGGGSQASMRHLTNIFRRVYRIFAHAWFQHRGVFWQVEGHEGLYVFFKTVCDVYQLIPEDNYTIPNEAEGADGDTMETPVEKKNPELGRVSLSRKNGESGENHVEENGEGEATTTISVGATTRRHKHTPSTGSHVTTIAEGLEEEEPLPKDGDENASSEQVEPPRGRPVLSGEDRIANGLGKLSLADLGKTKTDGAAEQPTPQPQNVEKNPMDDFGKNDASTSGAEPAMAGAATGSEAEGEMKEEETTEQGSDSENGSEDSSAMLGSSVETAVEAGGKGKEDENEGFEKLEDVEDSKEETIETEAKVQ
jgi:Mob1/phocein family